ncbi:MAG TPA: NADH:flavin oxidoreductase [Syntrophorhabdaceae bacterium]|nr:NADH:flavin oxidoreductase [Syntrophorhabdaceae bacterium]HQE81088.1 NADH:flavin oxidoreductase [Syntrophorhabdaceae bacterium]HQH44239.1 NADH:flavin oxidoreductase [Syntrophorhabdaceae bacterium]HQK47435.1 NADH:flavin oxidoreductase [Syntrophorhabdaceae bacterium]
MNLYPNLFSPIKIKGLNLSNRITMAPMYVGYADAEGKVTELVLDHYKKMGASGASLIVVENMCIDPSGLGAPFMLRVDKDEYIDGLKKIADTIHNEGAYAFAQINHAGRYAFMRDRIAPSPVKVWDVTPREMTVNEIKFMIERYADAALRIKKAGFDGVELHGGTGYLLSQFVSPRLNKRTDEYGGSLEARMRFPIEVLEAVRKKVGEEYPVGYRLLADELYPGGLTLDEAVVFAKTYAEKGIDYLSVMVGTHESFKMPPYVEMERNEGYMVPFAEAIKKALPETVIIAAGRIQTPQYADRVIKDKEADLIGLARVLFSDPLWPKKAKGEIAEPIVTCNPSCSQCMDMIMKGKRPYCSQWSKQERQDFIKKIEGK